MHEPFLQKGRPYQRKTAIGLEENTQGRGTVFLRIYLMVKQGELEPVRIGLTNSTSRVPCGVKMLEQHRREKVKLPQSA